MFHNVYPELRVKGVRNAKQKPAPNTALQGATAGV